MNGALDFIAALVIGVLAGMGVGGGGLLVLWLIFISGAEQLTAQGINIIFYICATAASLIVHLKNRKLPAGAILILSITGAAGAVGGCIVADIIDAGLLRRLFGGMLAVAGAAVFFKKSEN